MLSCSAHATLFSGSSTPFTSVDGADPWLRALLLPIIRGWISTLPEALSSGFLRHRNSSYPCHCLPIAPIPVKALLHEQHFSLLASHGHQNMIDTPWTLPSIRFCFYINHYHHKFQSGLSHHAACHYHHRPCAVYLIVVDHGTATISQMWREFCFKPALPDANLCSLTAPWLALPSLNVLQQIQRVSARTRN